MATPSGLFLSSPLPSIPVSNAPSPSTLAAKTVVDDTEALQSQVSEILTMCDALEIQVEAAFEAIEQAFNVETAQPEHISALMASLELFKQRLITSGLGALPGGVTLEPSDLDIKALVAKRLKETQAAFAASQRSKELAENAQAILQQQRG